MLFIVYLETTVGLGGGIDVISTALNSEKQGK